MSIKAVIRRNIKARARDMLRGSWGTAILILVLVLLVSLGFNMLQMGLQSAFGLYSVQEIIDGHEPSNVYELFDMFRMLAPTYILSGIMSIVIFFVMAPITFGVTDWFMQLMSGTKQDVSYVFNWLGDGKKYVRSLAATFLVNLKSFLWMLPFTIVATASSLAVTVLLIGSADRMLGLYIVVFLLLMLFLIAGGVLMTIFLQRYMLVSYLSIRFPEMRMREVFRRSVAMMKDHKAESFVLTLSFIGWYLLLIPSCGFIMLYIYPYITASMALFAFYVMDSHSAQHSGEAEAAGAGAGGGGGGATVYELPTGMQESHPAEVPQEDSQSGGEPVNGGEQPEGESGEPASGENNETDQKQDYQD